MKLTYTNIQHANTDEHPLFTAREHVYPTLTCRAALVDAAAIGAYPIRTRDIQGLLLPKIRQRRRIRRRRRAWIS